LRLFNSGLVEEVTTIPLETRAYGIHPLGDNAVDEALPTIDWKMPSRARERLVSPKKVTALTGDPFLVRGEHQRHWSWEIVA